MRREKTMIPPRIELGTFCVLGRCDNRYTTEPLYHISYFEAYLEIGCCFTRVASLT